MVNSSQGINTFLAYHLKSSLNLNSINSISFDFTLILDMKSNKLYIHEFTQNLHIHFI